MKIRIDVADKYFSWYIRKRDGKCMRCYSPVLFGEKGQPLTHQNSHYFSRGKENTRFEPLNCDTLCMACHMRWGGDERDEYRAFKVKQMGEEGFKRLDVQAHTLTKKDRKMALLRAKELLKSLTAWYFGTVKIVIR